MMLPRYTFMVLALLVSGGLEIVVKYVLALGYLDNKLIILIQFAVIGVGLLGCVAEKMTISRKSFIDLTFYSFLFFGISLFELIIHGYLELIFLLDIYIILIASVIIAEYHRIFFSIDIFLIIFEVVSILSLIIIVKLYLTYGASLIRFLSFSEMKMLTHLWFVNTFAYSCAFGILCGGISWLRADMPRQNGIRRKCYYLIMLTFPVLYLLLSKSKGGLALTIIGAAILYFRAKVFLVLASIVGVWLFFGNYLLGIFVKFMMFGRTVPESEWTSKAFSMLTCRFEASYFRQNQIGFLFNYPFGVGTSKAWATTYAVPGKDVVMKNHSLLLILIDSYGVLAVLFIGFLIARGFYTKRLTACFFLGLCMLAVPVTVINEPSLAYAIPLMIMMSGQTLRNGSGCVKI